MSELNLIPNPQIMLVQAAIFVSQVYVINKFLVVPFTRLKKLRSNATVGADSKSDEMKKEITVLSDEIRQRLSKMSDEIKGIKEAERIRAKKTRDEELAQAQKEMTDLVNSARKSVEANLQAERKKLATLTDTFVGEVYAKLSN